MTSPSVMFYPGGSYVAGKERVTLELMEGLQARGIPVMAIVGGWNDGHYPQLLRQARIPFAEAKLGTLHLRRPDWTIDGLLSLPDGIRHFRRAVRSFRPDVFVHTALKQFRITRALLPKTTRHVFHVHDMNFAAPSYPFALRALRAADGVVCVSRFVAEQFPKEALTRPALVVHNGLKPVAAPLPRIRDVNSPFQFGIVGQILPRKRHLTVVEAVQLLAVETPEKFKVNIFGDASTKYARDVQHSIFDAGLNDYFVWRGHYSNPADIYAEIDAVLAPAVNEPFGTTILEAGLYARASIASRSGGFPEMVDDSRTALLVKPDSPVELAAAMQRLLENPQLVQAMAQEARAHINLQFNVKGFVEAYADALSSILDDAQRRHVNRAESDT